MEKFITKEYLENNLKVYNNTIVKPLVDSVKIQYTEMPEATEDNKGVVVQYVGETDDNYTKGSFYENKLVDEVYTWTKMSGEAGGTDKTVLLEDDLYCYTKVGNIDASATSGVKVGSAGDSLNDVFNTMFGAKDEQPSVTEPSITLTVCGTQSGTYSSNLTSEMEEGTTISTLYFKSTASKGSYSYDEDTGVTLNSVSVEYAEDDTEELEVSNYPNFTFSKADVDFVVGTTASKSVTITMDYSDGNVAKTLLGNDSEPEKKIEAGSKTATCTFNPTSVNYVYYKLDTASTAPTSSLTKDAKVSTFKSNGKEFPYANGQYLWLYAPTSDLKVYTEALGQWAEDTAVPTPSEVTIALSSGKSKTYYAYRVGPFSAAGKAKYKLS